MRAWDEMDGKILDLLQNDFPLAIKPFQAMAEQLGLSETELLDRIAAMKETGLIRRIGGIMDSRNLGFYSTLCALVVPEARIEQVAQAINLLPGVTHNYLREHRYNMWFTLTASSPKVVQEILQELESQLGLTIINMPAEKVYKIKVSFDMGVTHD
jgi:siroheme decarboxylase